MITVACVNAGLDGGYLGRGIEYVRNLQRAVARHLSQPRRFVVFMDDPQYSIERGLDPVVETRPLPHPGLKGFMNKLALFKPGVFQDGERIVYLDLDTLITGPLDDIASYAGEFALLDDVMIPGQWGSGIMAWRGGFGAHIFERYIEAGCPHVEGGDQTWIMRQVKRADLLQDLYPNQIASYKMSAGVLSPHTRIVAFHGRPRPHEITEGWVPALWAGKPQTEGNHNVRVVR